MRFLKITNDRQQTMLYEMSGVVIEDHPNGSLRIILLNGKIIYFRPSVAKVFREFLTLPVWPEEPVLDVDDLATIISDYKRGQENSLQNIATFQPLPAFQPSSQTAPQLPLTSTLPVLPPTTHPGFPFGYGEQLNSTSPINSSKVVPINTPGKPTLNLNAIRKAAGIRTADEDEN